MEAWESIPNDLLPISVKCDELNKIKIWIAICILSPISFCFGQIDNNFSFVDDEGLGDMKMVFEPGLKVGKYKVSKTFQPSFVITSKGTLLVFCQGRLFGGADNDPKVILMNRSNDYGQTWQGVEVLSAPINFFAISPYTVLIDGHEKISFLTCVGLKVTKKIYRNDLTEIKNETGINIDQVGPDKAAVLVKYTSIDDGQSWEMEYLNDKKTPLYKNYNGYIPVFMNTIGQVHQIPEGPYKGRMVLAAPIYATAPGDSISDNFRNHKCVGSGIIYSDDQGDSWQMDDFIKDYIGNEASAVSINNGNEILMIRRMNNPDRYEEHNIQEIINPSPEQRIAHLSKDGGKTWSDPYLLDISEVKCHGTLARVNNRLYFSIPAGLEDQSQQKEKWDDDRIRGSIYYSDDEGESWNSKVIEESYYSYSTVGALTEKMMITFFSRGGHGRFGIGYRIFTDEWLDAD